MEAVDRGSAWVDEEVLLLLSIWVDEKLDQQFFKEKIVSPIPRPKVVAHSEFFSFVCFLRDSLVILLLLLLCCNCNRFAQGKRKCVS